MLCYLEQLVFLAVQFHCFAQRITCVASNRFRVSLNCRGVQLGLQILPGNWPLRLQLSEIRYIYLEMAIAVHYFPPASLASR